jgi:hypothetical protein
VPGTSDDIIFDASFTPRYQRNDGTISVDYASPTGLEWSALGLVFEPISGAVALTNSVNGCLGAQLPAPAPAYPNWDGGVRITFVGPGGVPGVVSRVSFNMAGISTVVQAFDAAGNLLGSDAATSFSDQLTVTAPGIARADINGQFWCIATFVEYDDLVVSIASLIAQIGPQAADGEIDPGVAASLVAKLEATDAAVASGQNNVARNVLNAFINQITAQTGKHVSAAAAAALIASAQALLATL